MTLDGYFFAATGLSSYAFYDGDECVLSVAHHVLPNEPLRIAAGDRSWTFQPAPGVDQVFLDDQGREAARLYRWDACHFAIAAPGVAMTGRVIQDYRHRSILYTGLNEEPIAILEHGFNRLLSRERYGVWSPRRFAATLWDGVDEALRPLALAAPFLGLDGIRPPKRLY